MTIGAGSRIDAVLPVEAWDLLERDSAAMLVDVRSAAEWSFVGIPDLSSVGREAILVEWQVWPGMSPNPRFVDDLLEAMAGRPATALLFLCRSGIRSLAAAELVSAVMAERGVDVGCINIAGGFEGDLDAQRHRGGLSGWKFEGLPWRQT